MGDLKMLSVLELIQEAYKLGQTYDKRDHLPEDELQKLLNIEEQIIQAVKEDYA